MRINHIFIVIIIISFFLFSCKKERTENIIFGKYIFVKSEFVGNIECYDSAFNLIDVPPVFKKNDFLFNDGFDYPYKRIEINKDSTVKYFYIRQELEISVDGSYSLYKDSIYFFVNNSLSSLFNGYVKNDILYIPSYGYKNQFMYEGVGYNSYFSGNGFGVPDIRLIGNYGYSRIYIQKFNLTYIKQ
jgi:hypothetical protein